jgi:hypothetical protein
MTGGQTAATVRCPECSDPIIIAVQLTNATLAFDLAPARAHVDTHAAAFTTELPPVAR